MPRTYQAAGSRPPVLVLAHGAGAGQDHPWMKKVAAGLAERGVTVVTFDFDYIEAGRKTPDRAPALEAKWAAVWKDVVAGLPRGTTMFAGGKSMGGRIASQVAANGAFDPAPAGLIFFGYPLHPPGRIEQRRDRHLPNVAPPMLFLHGTRDPFGSPDEMRELVAELPRSTLEIINGSDHSLVALKRDDPERRSLDRATEYAADWIRRLTT